MQLKTPNSFRIANPIVTVLSVIIGLVIWFPSPFYPDELAFRIGSSRFIQNNYIYLGLYPFCYQTPPSLPWIYWPSAWILSFIEINFSAIYLRILPTLAILTCVITICLNAYKRNSYQLLPILSLICIGVSGSGLILNRYEFLIVAQVGFSLIGISSFNTNTITKIIITIFLIFLTLTNVLIHPQGILFLFLTFLICLKLLKNINFIARYISLAAILFLLILSFIKRPGKGGCLNFPEIDKSFDSMVLNLTYFQNLNIIDFFQNKISLYVDSFIYKDEYLVNYLPGVLDWSNQFYLIPINSFIIFSVTTILIINLILTVVFTFSIILCCFKEGVKYLKFEINKIFYLLISSPALFLFFYDLNQYFYRTFFIHLLLILSMSFYLTNVSCELGKVRSKKINYLINFLLLFCLCISFVSTALNYKHFFYSLPDWSAIATTPRKFVNTIPTDEINVLAKSCDIDLNKGGLVTDAYTYEYFKSKPNIIDIYYIFYGENVTKETIEKIANLSGANSVLASCKGMKNSNVGWPPDNKFNHLCCSTLTK